MTDPNNNNSGLRRAAVWSIFTLAVVSGIFVLFYIEPHVLESYVISNPRVPQESSGHIHAYNLHGVIIYFSSSQQHNLLWLKALGVLQLFVAGIAWHCLGFAGKRLPEIRGNGI
ncbi:hypothetical protein OVA13_07710 [Pseudoxanthomonas sp. SL93]|uniref:hypothetical protein n=1 Tax=Pseudoxanthomonas sp. SL93 TaxID=2995142 RepID=UPI00226E0288|nr:hypothetical protein [Pseudoxanthomonas sp. SL93]WAC64628.1 hypothetical protein OVA13_07710 [Pseudoxanthomonas sp. SL93]